MKNRGRSICAILVLVMMIVAPISAQVDQMDQEQGARGIFQLEQGDGFAIDIMLKRPDSEVWLNVPPDTVFRNGDRVKLGLRGNFDGYIYIVNIGTSGTRRIMVPNPSVTDNHLQKGVYRQYLVGELAGEPGEETLYLISAPTKILEFERAIAENKGVLNLPESAKKTESAEQPQKEDGVIVVSKGHETITTKKADESVVNQPVSTKKKSKYGVLKSVGAAAVKILGIISLFSREVDSEYSPEDGRTFVASTQGRLKGGEFVAFEVVLRHEK
jgi:hypothetical protein